MVYDEFNLEAAWDHRADSNSKVADDSVFYIVHEVSAGTSKWLRHDLILADKLQELILATADIQAKIFKTTGGLGRIVFLSSMRAHDEELRQVAADEHVYLEIDAMHASGNGAYVLFGIVGGEYTTLMDVRTKDAISALDMAIKRVRDQHNENFEVVELSVNDSSINYGAIQASFKQVSIMYESEGNVVVH